jgi:hypothetical protein
MLSLFAAVALAAAPAAAEPTLTPPQATALRCSVVFALGARLQADQSLFAAGWPPLGTRGKEYFVRVTAQLMDDTGASRETLTAMAMRQVPALSDPRATAAAMPACLQLLEASGQ